MKRILTYFLILSLVICTHVWGDTFFVDFTSGSDSNNGTSTVTAWKYAPGMSLATGNSASTNLAAGDIVYFKMGEAFYSTCFTASYDS